MDIAELVNGPKKEVATSVSTKQEASGRTATASVLPADDILADILLPPPRGSADEQAKTSAYLAQIESNWRLSVGTVVSDTIKPRERINGEHRVLTWNSRGAKILPSVDWGYGLLFRIGELSTRYDPKTAAQLLLVQVQKRQTGDPTAIAKAPENRFVQELLREDVEKLLVPVACTPGRSGTAWPWDSTSSSVAVQPTTAIQAHSQNTTTTRKSTNVDRRKTTASGWPARIDSLNAKAKKQKSLAAAKPARLPVPATLQAIQPPSQMGSNAGVLPVAPHPVLSTVPPGPQLRLLHPTGSKAQISSPATRITFTVPAQRPVEMAAPAQVPSQTAKTPVAVSNQPVSAIPAAPRSPIATSGAVVTRPVSAHDMLRNPVAGSQRAGLPTASAMNPTAQNVQRNPTNGMYGLTPAAIARSMAAQGLTLDTAQGRRAMAQATVLTQEIQKGAVPAAAVLGIQKRTEPANAVPPQQAPTTQTAHPTILDPTMVGSSAGLTPVGAPLNFVPPAPTTLTVTAAQQPLTPRLLRRQPGTISRGSVPDQSLPRSPRNPMAAAQALISMRDAVPPQLRLGSQVAVSAVASLENKSRDPLKTSQPRTPTDPEMPQDPNDIVDPEAAVTSRSELKEQIPPEILLLTQIPNLNLGAAWLKNRKIQEASGVVPLQARLNIDRWRQSIPDEATAQHETIPHIPGRPDGAVSAPPTAVDSNGPSVVVASTAPRPTETTREVPHNLVTATDSALPPETLPTVPLVPQNPLNPARILQLAEAATTAPVPQNSNLKNGQRGVDTEHIGPTDVRNTANRTRRPNVALHFRPPKWVDGVLITTDTEEDLARYFRDWLTIIENLKKQAPQATSNNPSPVPGEALAHDQTVTKINWQRRINVGTAKHLALRIQEIFEYFDVWIANSDLEQQSLRLGITTLKQRREEKLVELLKVKQEMEENGFDK